MPVPTCCSTSSLQDPPEPDSGFCCSGEAAAAACTPTPPPTASTHLEFIADYVLDSRKAGSGGLGVVYPALHQPSGRRVALKLGSAFVPHELQG